MEVCERVISSSTVAFAVAETIAKVAYQIKQPLAPAGE